MTDAEAHEQYAIDLLALAAAQAIMDSFRGFGERDELWPTIGFVCRTQALAQWQNIIHNAIDVMMTTPSAPEAAGGGEGE